MKAQILCRVENFAVNLIADEQIVYRVWFAMKKVLMKQVLGFFILVSGWLLGNTSHHFTWSKHNTSESITPGTNSI